MERINGYFGYRAIAELRILQAPLASSAASRGSRAGRRRCALRGPRARRRSPTAAARGAGPAQADSCGAQRRRDRCTGASPQRAAAPHYASFTWHFEAFCLIRIAGRMLARGDRPQRGPSKFRERTTRSQPSVRINVLAPAHRADAARAHCSAAVLLALVAGAGAHAVPALGAAGKGPERGAGRGADEARRPCRTRARQCRPPRSRSSNTRR